MVDVKPMARVLALACLAWALSATAVLAAPTGPALTPKLEERAVALTSELRCLVCQNQTIADSQSELAIQLKREVRQQLARGATDEQVRRFMVQRYGDFVLYRPRVNQATALLWGGPLLLLALGGVLLALHWRERRAAFEGVPDSVLPDEAAEGVRA